MGSIHSKDHRRRRQQQPDKHLNKTSTHNNSSSLTTTPNLSRSSSTINSRATSMIEDVKGCVHKMLGRSSTDLPPRFYTRRSFSAPAELFTIDDNDQKIPCPSITNEEEQDRLINTHFVLKHCFGDNFAAPVHDLLSRPLTRKDSMRSVNSTSSKNTPSTRVLDVACGSGVWVLEMATNYPNSDFHGIDIAPVFPNSIKPSNSFFQQCDMLDPGGFPYPDEYFDYIHMRLVYNCFSTTELKFVLKEMNRVLKPGGYIEFRDIDPVIKNPGPVTEHVFSGFAKSMYEKHSIDVTWTKSIGEILQNEAELSDVHYQKAAVGFGDSESLSSIKCSFLDTLYSYKDYLMSSLGLDASKLDKQIETIKKECSLHHSYFSYYMSWGRKPLTHEKLATPISVPIETSILENAYDIVHLTQGFIE